MFRETMPLEDTWKYSLIEEFIGIRPQEGYTARDLTHKIFDFICEKHSIPAWNLLARGGFKEREDIERLAETGWDYTEGNLRGFRVDGTYALKFHHMSDIHFVMDQFLNPLVHILAHIDAAPGLVLYDPEKMIRGEEERCHEFGEYHFLEPDKKKDAVVGIIEFDLQESENTKFMRMLDRALRR